MGQKPYPLMDGKQRRPLEALSTLGAAVGPLPSVIPHVVLQPRRTFEGFSALRAAVRPLCVKVRERFS